VSNGQEYRSTVNEKQIGRVIDASVAGLWLTYLIWGLRGLAVVAAIAVAYVVLMGACLIDCSSGGWWHFGALAAAAVIGVAVVYPRQFLLACGMVLYGILWIFILLI
jgi:hypothetical protein